MGDASEDPQLEALRARIQQTRARIAAACERAGRDADAVCMVAVSKTFPAEAVVQAARLGLVDFGENRVQELTDKASALQGPDSVPVRWHMIGHLQRNKAREVVDVAELFHALDSSRLAKELHRRAEQAGRKLACLIQVNTSGEASKFGVEPDHVPSLLNDVHEFDSLEIRGLMTIAAPADDPESVRHEFQLLRRIRDELAQHHRHLSLDYLSMGMSADFEVAIEEGATHVRVGSAIFGRRDGP